MNAGREWKEGGRRKGRKVGELRRQEIRPDGGGEEKEGKRQK
jgi:hypothetical protein